MDLSPLEPADETFDECEERSTASIDVARIVEQRDRAVLVQLSGAEAGRVVPLAQERTTLLGRGRTCGAVFDDSSLSRVHARIHPRRGRVTLTDAGSRNGTYVNDRRITETVLREGDRIRLGTGAALQLQWVSEDEQKALLDMYASSTRDALTGIGNRRYLDQRLIAEVAYAVRHGTELGVLMLDVDHFKKINDSWGHLAGDAVLRRLASKVLSTVRTEDLVARYGGEELVVVVRGATTAAAAMMAERVRREVGTRPFGFGAASIPVTVSIGCATLACCTERTPSALLARADARLYRAKAAGRNCVVAVDKPSCGD